MSDDRDEVLEREDLDDLAADYPLPDYVEAEEAGW
jgi:hypothetical protein